MTKTDLSQVAWESWKQSVRCSEEDFTSSGEQSPDLFVVTGEPFLDNDPRPEFNEKIEWLNGKSKDGKPMLFLRADFHRVHPVNNQSSGNIKIGTEVVDRWWGLRSDYEPDDLVQIPESHRIIDHKEYWYREEALPHLLKMIDAAAEDGIIIRVNSSYRTFEYQVGLYERATKKDGDGQRYSAPPGHSEHQLGTCVDLTDPEEKFAFTEEFDTTEQGRWLAANAKRFGFRRSYTQQNKAETGYISEPWHWRFIGF